MYRMICVLLFSMFVLSAAADAQRKTLTGTVTDAAGGEALPGARIKLDAGKGVGAVCDANGRFTIPGLDTGSYEARVSMMGYQTLSTNIIVTDSDSTVVVFKLAPLALEGEEIVVSGTRTQRSIADVPVRVEAIPQEEVEEKILMRPASVSMLLNESPGVRVQNTSGTSNTANIRIQGLDGRYTQLLVDGIPSFSGMGAGFGITQLIPLNLRQVEIVKGANSALYGADAIAGVVNFITKEPREERELSGLVNLTSQKGYDVSCFYGESFGAFGLTMLASYNHQDRFDVNSDNFSDIAGYTRITLTPKLEYHVASDLTAVLTGSYFKEDRLGGVMSATEDQVGQNAPYLESNKTVRANAALSLDYTIGAESVLSLRGAITDLDRHSYYGATAFDATQLFVISDATYSLHSGSHNLLFGAAVSDEDFHDNTAGIVASRSYRYFDVGAWAQDELTFSTEWSALASTRLDHHNIYGTFVTPRASVLFKPTNEWSVRLGVGSGFKAPTIFLEDAELYGFRNVRPIGGADAETAQSTSFDVNYKTVAGELGIKLNLALYSTWLEHALIVDPDSLDASIISIRNVDGLTWTGGGELSGQFTLGDFKLSLSYVYLDTRQRDRGRTDEIELNPHHWLGVVLMYENSEAQLKAGMENYYTSPQHLERNPQRTTSPDYSLTGFVIEKGFGDFRVFLNAENIFDIRQSRFGPTFTGDPITGTFRPLHVYAPMEGRAFNAGVRFVLD